MLQALLLSTPLLGPMLTSAPIALRDLAPASVEPLEVEILTEDDVTLQADFWAPRDEDERAPAALLVHDAGESRAQLAGVADKLHRIGFAVLSIDLRGHGGSVSEDYDWSTLDVQGQERLWAYATRDVQAAASWLRGRREVHSTNLNLVGVRAGCALIVRHAVRDENVRSLAVIAPTAEVLGFDLTADIEELAGLPVYLFAPRARREAMEAMVSTAHEGTGLEYIELTVQRSRTGDCLEDRKLGTDLAKWLKEKAFPRRGR